MLEILSCYLLQISEKVKQMIGQRDFLLFAELPAIEDLSL